MNKRMPGYRLFIITGTSQGIGQAVAKSLLANGDLVYGISRTDSTELNQYFNYKHTLLNLRQVDNIEDTIHKLLKNADHINLNMVCLINNAAMLEPLLPIEKCAVEDISANIHTSLISPMVLTSVFIRATKEWNLRRKVINISSGSGTFANPSMSVYSTAKAGLNMFTRCVGVEQSSTGNPVEVIAVDPGMVETNMQQIARSKNEEEFITVNFFKEAYLKGQLQSKRMFAEHFMRIIDEHYESGSLVTVNNGSD